ncbi:hypothetical protein ACHAXN_011132 [Cyclotella atomus]
MHRSRNVLLRHTSLISAGGRFSSLLDMGGAPQAAVNTRINVGKNNKIRAVALDFHLITRSIEQRRKDAELNGAAAGKKENVKLEVKVKPDMSMVEKMASLLNVKLGDSSPIGQRKNTQDNDSDEDLASVLLGNKNDKEQPKKTPTTSPHMDIRSKYASKLRNKIEGGVAGIDLLNYERGELSKRGDASSLLTAKAVVASAESSAVSSNPSSSRWLASTGVGQLLSFLTQRSMQIILLPTPSTTAKPQTESDKQRNEDEMTSLTKQLPHVQFDLCIPDGRRRGDDPSTANEDAACDILDYMTSEIDIPSLQYAVVSDRDDYLRSARERGMFTIRVRPKNTRRGDVTASYSVEDVGAVEEIINEINGISFNSALKR